MELTRRRGVVSLQDSQSCIPLSDHLKDGDIILLLTPGIAPDVNPSPSDLDNPPSDPFEPLGKALAKHHPWVRHVPYLPRNGITGTHVVHIRLAAAVIFVISGPPRHGQPSQLALAEITKALCETRPQIILTCCNLQELGPLEQSFPTILEVPGFAPPDLEAAADVLFEPRKPSPKASKVQNITIPPKAWAVEVWDDDRELSDILDLWCQCFPETFHLDPYRFRSLLRRDGYAMHYVVRKPGAAQILGFCATYTTYADSGGERLLGSLAALLVHPSYRQQGIGLSLHTHARRQLTKIRGVCRLQLGSTFPRLLYGLPVTHRMRIGFWNSRVADKTALLKLGLWATSVRLGFSSSRIGDNWFDVSHLSFVPCEFAEFDMVLEFVEKESMKKDTMGWYDQYAKLANTMNIQDIVLGLEGGTIIAAALTYVKNTGSPAADDLPWASTIADDVGECQLTGVLR
ncbi:hypothetical protein CHGG_07176 [Chaetomium globosum CBS 148.51]|uniref:N-acetyltransferase domain-containing protein n=1 Tax=Chaetomium globosum (strain ATCC 6205 / CBS 148.51 / DSM 1962 / NBRC 6347 / NRRL 1970) TaxID=306901 RepID=Q2GXX8_CHAGB|nr:uncharacterized protein CHGG_07176 [Chaetomium globosum CBS 148.51]EAQ85923.1 hypothetical protein CHGG_07176 [Chaetomium globosum CBS 148.51]